MPIYKETDVQHGRIVNTGGDYNKAGQVLKDRLFIVSDAQEASRQMSCGFKYDLNINELEVYVNGVYMRCNEDIYGIEYGDYEETTNYSVTFNVGVISAGNRVRFRVTANSYDYSGANLDLIESIESDILDLTTDLTQLRVDFLELYKYVHDVRVIDATTDIILTIDDLDYVVRMNSEFDQTITLPNVGSTQDSRYFEIMKLNVGKLTIQADVDDKIMDSSTGGLIYNDKEGEIFANITLKYVHITSTWFVMSANGTWVTI